MMMRENDYLMTDGRHARLKSLAATARLDEMIRVLRSQVRDS